MKLAASISSPPILSLNIFDSHLILPSLNKPYNLFEIGSVSFGRANFQTAASTELAIQLDAS